MSDSVKEATMILPPDGMNTWTTLMQETPAIQSANINNGSPIVMAYARFDDGTQVTGGVYKWTDPVDGPINIKFMWVFDANGDQYEFWPIDTSDDEDFLATSYAFSLPAGPNDNYLLNVTEMLGENSQEKEK